jgi:hypothetical protein
MATYIADDGYGVTIRITHNAPKLIAAMKALADADELVGNGCACDSQHTADEIAAKILGMVEAYEAFIATIDCDCSGEYSTFHDALNGWVGQVRRHEEAVAAGEFEIGVDPDAMRGGHDHEFSERSA